MSPADQDALLLLCARFAAGAEEGVRPLTAPQYSALAGWLRELGARPGGLLEDPVALLKDLPERHGRVRLERDRILSLLDRGTALGFARQRWKSRGVWTLTRADEDYPGHWRSRLGNRMPPVLFGLGVRGLLGRPGLAVVGSRASTEVALSWARDLGRFAAEKALPLVSGAAPGADTAALEGAAEAGGEIVLFPARGLLKATRTSIMADALAEGRALLLAEGGLDPASFVGEAMARNRLIYASAESSVVVHGHEGKGGTWQGACECLRHSWCPLWVVDHPDAGTAFGPLLKAGAKALHAGEWGHSLLKASGDEGEGGQAARVVQPRLF